MNLALFKRVSDKSLERLAESVSKALSLLTGKGQVDECEAVNINELSLVEYLYYLDGGLTKVDSDVNEMFAYALSNAENDSEDPEQIEPVTLTSNMNRLCYRIHGIIDKLIRIKLALCSATEAADSTREDSEYLDVSNSFETLCADLTYANNVVDVIIDFLSGPEDSEKVRDDDEPVRVTVNLANKVAELEAEVSALRKKLSK